MQYDSREDHLSPLTVLLLDHFVISQGATILEERPPLGQRHTIIHITKRQECVSCEYAISSEQRRHELTPTSTSPPKKEAVRSKEYYAPRPISNYHGGSSGPRSSRVSHHSTQSRGNGARVSREYTRTSKTYVR